LLKNGADKELKNLEGQTALDIARKAQNKDAIDLLSSK
jgi:ankyrin repeat protein